MRSATFSVTVTEHDDGDTELEMDGGDGWAIRSFVTALTAMIDGAPASGEIETMDGQVIRV